MARSAGSPKKRGRRGRFWRYTLIGFGAVMVIGIGVAVGFVAAAVRGMPALSGLEPNPALTSFIYDINGEVVAEVAGWENRIPIKLDQAPQALVDAFIAIEDIRFWDHHGVDLMGIARALYRDLIHASIKEGASTITQQFARNAFGLGYDQTITRKIREVILAIQIEREYTKDEILEMYLNQIWFGHSAYGVQAAAKLYFNKDVSQLTLPESALICAVAANANIYSPYLNADRAVNRRNLVLDTMAANGFITAEAAGDAKATPLELAGLPPENYPAAYFVDYVVEYLLDRYDADTVYRGGLRVYTTLDYPLQQHLEQAMHDNLDEAVPIYDSAGERITHPEFAAVFLDPDTGGIRAMIGGREHQKRLELNRAVPPRGNWEGTLRQPGSAFKPIVDYAPAIEIGGWSASSILDDWPTTYHLPGQEPWTPQNYNLLYGGLTTLREGLELSVNTIAVKLLNQIGVETGVRYARKLGIDSLVLEGSHTDSSLAVAIGGLTQGVSVLDMAQAYAVFANGGIRVEPFAVLRVEDKYGNIIEETRPDKEVVLDPRTAYIVTDMLKGVVTHGTGWRANPGRPAAGKTGTTDNDYDAWFVGYTPEVVGALWMGYDQPKRMNDIFGGTYNAPIWKQAVSAWLEGKPVRDWEEPDGLVRMIVCKESGLLPGPSCSQDHWREEIFFEGRQPLLSCDVHTTATVCAQRPWQLATADCAYTQTRVFIQRREPWVPYQQIDEKSNRLLTYVPADATWQKPTEYCDLHGLGDPLPPGPHREAVLAVYKWAFSPNELTVPLGTVLTLKIQSQDANHGFAIPAYGIDVIAYHGQQVQVTFVCDQAGTFTWYSSVYAGKETRNMTGTLIVAGGE